MIIAILSGKGGSCKTTTALAFAAILSKKHKILVVDADPQCSLGWVAEKSGAKFDVVEESDPDALGKLSKIGGYDYIICDSAPGLSGEAIATIAKLSDYIVLPTSPSPLDIRELTRTIKQIIIPSNTPYRVMFGRVDYRRVGEAETLQDQLTTAGIPVFKALVRSRVAHERAIIEEKLITQYQGSGGKDALKDYQAVVKQLMGDLKDA